MALTAAERELAKAIQFDEGICEIISQQCGRKLNRLMALTDEFEQQPMDGLSISAGRREVESLVAALQARLTEYGYRTFWSEYFEPNGASQGDEIAILRTSDPYDILRIRRSNGGNYDVSTDDVITRLKEWETRCKFEIVGAASAWVAVQFVTLPENVCTFAEEVYRFCPDTVDQGVGLMNERDHPEEFAAARELCPTLSEEMQQQVEQQSAEFQKMEMPPELREYFASEAGFTTSTDMGIRLLAHSLQTTRQLFLWWD